MSDKTNFIHEGNITINKDPKITTIDQMTEKLWIGHNIFIKHGLLSSAAYSESLGANFYQIFLTSPQSYNFPRQNPEELLNLGILLQNNNMKIVVHASYMLNFCNPPTSKIHKSAIHLLTQDLHESTALNAIGVIVHMGKNVKSLKLSEDEALDNFVTGITNCLCKTPKESIVILETGAGVGTEVGTSIYALGKLYKRFKKKHRKRIKFCIDTCHIFAAGYDITSPRYVNMFVDIIDTHLGWNNVACIHLNDSKCPVGSCKDRHADIGTGYIGEVGLRHFIRHCYVRQVPIVLETPCDVMSKKEQIDQVKSWIYD